MQDAGFVVDHPPTHGDVVLQRFIRNTVVYKLANEFHSYRIKETQGLPRRARLWDFRIGHDSNRRNYSTDLSGAALDPAGIYRAGRGRVSCLPHSGLALRYHGRRYST